VVQIPTTPHLSQMGLTSSDPSLELNMGLASTSSFVGKHLLLAIVCGITESLLAECISSMYAVPPREMLVK